MGKWIILTGLIALLGLAVIFSYWAWNLGGEAEMSPHGYIAMLIGSFMSLVIGGGLMALLFYSSRHGYDEHATTKRVAYSAKNDNPTRHSPRNAKENHSTQWPKGH